MNIGDINDRTQTYEYEGNGFWRGTSALVKGVIRTIEDITFGRLSQQGIAIKNASNGETVTTIPRLSNSVLMWHPPNNDTRPEGAISILRDRENNQFSAGPADNAYFGAAFNFNYSDANGDEHTFESPMIGLSKIGSRLWYREIEDGRYEYRNIINNPDHREEELAARIDGFQIAPLGIAAQRALAVYLMRNYWNDLVDILEAGVTDENGNELTSESEVAYFVANVNLDNVQLISRSYIGIANL